MLVAGGVVHNMVNVAGRSCVGAAAGRSCPLRNGVMRLRTPRGASQASRPDDPVAHGAADRPTGCRRTSAGSSALPFVLGSVS